MENKVYDVKEVAKLLNVGESTVRELVKQGKLKKIPIGKPIRIPEASVNELLGLSVQTAPKTNRDEIVFTKKDILDLIDTATDIQKGINRLLISLQNKLK